MHAYNGTHRLYVRYHFTEIVHAKGVQQVVCICVIAIYSTAEGHMLLQKHCENMLLTRRKLNRDTTRICSQQDLQIFSWNIVHVRHASKFPLNP